MPRSLSSVLLSEARVVLGRADGVLVRHKTGHYRAAHSPEKPFRVLAHIVFFRIFIKEGNMGKARVSVVMIIKRVWLCLLLLLNVGCGLIRPMFSPESKVGEPGSTLSPSSALAQNELENLFQRALNDASFRKVKEKLEGRGFVPIYDLPFGWAYERGSILFLPFRPASGERGAPGEEPLPSSKPKSPGGPKPGQPRRPPELPKHPTPTSADPAYAIYVAYVDGPSLAFGVVDEGNTTVNVLPDVDRSLLSPDVRGEEVLGQLRANERFRKFEDHHASQGRSLWARIVIDETSRTAYILVTVGMPDPATTPYSLKPPEPPVVKPDYVVTACYLGVCPALSYGSGQTTLDVSKFELFHAGEDALRPSQFTQDFDGIKVAELGEPVLYTIYAGGERPVVLDLPGFGFYSVLRHDDYKLMPHPLAHYGEGGGRALNLVLWGLLDIPAKNVLLQFKTDAELLLEAYNRAMKSSDIVFGAVGVDLSSSRPILIAEFDQLSTNDLQDLPQMFDEALIRRDEFYLKVPIRVLVADFERKLGMRLVDVGIILLDLAQAFRTEAFDELYEDLLEQGVMQRLLELIFYRPWNPDMNKAYVLALALEFERILMELAGERLKLQVFGIVKEVVFALAKEAASILVALILDAISARLRWESVPGFEVTQYWASKITQHGYEWKITFHGEDATQDPIRKAWSVVVYLPNLNEWFKEALYNYEQQKGSLPKPSHPRAREAARPWLTIYNELEYLFFFSPWNYGGFIFLLQAYREILLPLGYNNPLYLAHIEQLCRCLDLFYYLL